ncbi:hypothetical protein B0H63DRAFT_480835 [Podospora didyma]|uniref:Uncharacterized protein n=1 Tax=Podospora didyma TaxID=330526 RepID=A0AAE0KF31_9PEZI|nr:hypothetical protein B0H63DRAFT_480835 [Podospora didyma]
MPSYFITGAARGIGYEFIRQYSSDPNNTVIGTVRDKAATIKKISEDAELKSRSNIHILEADITNYDALKNAAAETATITGGSLDYIIANAGIVTMFDAYDPIGALGDRPDEITKTLRLLFETHVIANVHLFNLLMPLILHGKAKKVILISSGFADPVFTAEFDITPGSLYASTKAAANMIVAKYSAQYKKDGVLFLAVCPGMVEVGHYKDATPEQIANVGGLVTKFKEYSTRFSGPITPEESVSAVRSVIANASIEKGNAGDFLSHFGTKTWL